MTEAKSGDGAGTTPPGDDSTGATAAAAVQPSTTKSAPQHSTKAASSRSADRARDGKGSGGPGKQAIDSVRSTVATVVWVAAVLAALVLAAGALVVALDFNAQNGVVKFLTETAGDINFLGQLKDFKPDRGPRADDAMTKEVLVNWGLCAVAYLVAGKVLDKLIRP